MRLLSILFCCILFFSNNAKAAGTKKVLLTDFQSKRLTKVNLWLEENLDPADCPDFNFFEVQKK